MAEPTTESSERTKNKDKDNRAGEKPRTKSSKVWEHFTLNLPKKCVSCKICKRELAWHGSTTSLHEHLKRKHVGVEAEDGEPERKKQPNISDYVWKKSCTPQQSAALTDSVLNMLVSDMRPLSMVEGEGFKKMITTLNPGYTIPSRTHFARLLEQKYQNTVEKVKSTIKVTDSKVALTADIWTSVATEAYLGITCHYIGSDWQINSVCLSTMPLEERHTAQNIAVWLEEQLERFDIPPDKIIGIVHDNGANIVAAGRILEEKYSWSSLRCTGHTLQLVLTSALKHPTINKAVGATRCLVEHFKKSELACTKLKQKQQQMGTPEHKLIQDVSTRWNSTYHMISRLLEQRWPVTATLSDATVTKTCKQYLDLKPDQWSLIEELSTALKPFDCATVYMSGEKYVTLSAVPPLVKGLVKSMQGMVFETAGVQAFQNTAIEQLEQRWKNETTFSDSTQNTVIISSALDPRFRKLKFLSPEDSFKVQVKIQMKTVEMEQLQPPSVQQEAMTDSTSPACDKPPISLLDTLLDSDTSSEDEGKEGEAENLTGNVRKEVLTYFGEKPIPKEENPLHWWKANELKYPALSRLAKSYLCIPSTSTPAERLFSAAGNIASKKRASLSPEHVDMLTFLHCNAKFFLK